MSKHEPIRDDPMPTESTQFAVAMILNSDGIYSGMFTFSSSSPSEVDPFPFVLDLTFIPQITNFAEEAVVMLNFEYIMFESELYELDILDVSINWGNYGIIIPVDTDPFDPVITTLTNRSQFLAYPIVGPRGQGVPKGTINGSVKPWPTGKPLFITVNYTIVTPIITDT